MNHIRLFMSVLVVFLVLQASSQEDMDFENRVLKGTTMGTYWGTQANCADHPTQEDIENRLSELNKTFSTYIPDSLISRFNDSNPEEWMDVDDDFMNVTQVAKEVYELSRGAFDPTLHPAVEVWGFGSTGPSGLPSVQDLSNLRATIGFFAIKVDRVEKRIRKSRPTSLDYSAVAKGYAVDELAEMINQNQCEGFLVDIGGEMRVSGSNEKGKDWQIGVEPPPGIEEFYGYIALNSGAVATSGTYRNVIDHEEETLSHILDPRTASPAKHQTVSVTVSASTAAHADAWATTLLVMGASDAMLLAKEQQLNALIVEQLNIEESIFNVHLAGDMVDLFHPMRSHKKVSETLRIFKY